MKLRRKSIVSSSRERGRGARGGRDDVGTVPQELNLLLGTHTQRERAIVIYRGDAWICCGFVGIGEGREDKGRSLGSDAMVCFCCPSREGKMMIRGDES